MSTVRHLERERTPTTDLRRTEVSGQSVYLSNDSPVPFYVQIAQQLTYLIYSRQLQPGTRLPSVRTLATGLEVTSNTISQAYYELQMTGLVDSFKGSGTFVRQDISEQDEDWHVRNEMAAEAVAGVRRRLHALGLDDSDLQRHVMGVIHGAECLSEIAFAAPSLISAKKFANSIGTKLGHLGIEVAAIGFNELEGGDQRTREIVSRVYRLVTFVSTAHTLKKLLEPYGQRHKIIGVSLELVNETLMSLAALDPAARVVIVTTERYLDISLNVVKSNSRLDPSHITRLRADEDIELLASHADQADRVIYTFGAGPIVDELGVPEDRRLLIGFRIDGPSMTNLATTLTSKGAS